VHIERDHLPAFSLEGPEQEIRDHVSAEGER